MDKRLLGLLMLIPLGGQLFRPGIAVLGVVQGRTDLKTGLVASWKCEEANGNRADATGNGWTLRQTSGVVGSAAGIIGNAASFTGAVGQFLQVPAAHPFHPGAGSFSVAYWVWFNALAASQEVLSVFTTTGNQREWFTGYGSGQNALRLQVSTDGINGIVVTQTAPSTGAWFFVAGGLDRSPYVAGRPNALWISVNGANPSFSTAAALAAPVFSGTAPMVASGVNVGTADRLNGRLDAANYWNRTLTRDEIARLYNGGAGLQYPF
jgi:hypothetical protein